MKIPLAGFISGMSLIAFFAAGLSPAHCQDSTGLLDQALDLVRQVEKPAGNPPPVLQQIDMLNQAVTLAQSAPNHRLKGHRVLAIQAIRSAISEIRDGDPNHLAAGELRTAETELATSVSLAKTDESGSAPSNQPSTPNQAVPPPAALTNASPPDNGSTPAQADIFNAVDTGDLVKLKSILAAPGVDVNVRDQLGRTPLYTAIDGYPWHKDAAAFLLAHGADPNLADDSGLTPLHQAALWIRADKMELLLAYKVDVNAKDKLGNTPLYEAISAGGRDDMAQLLLEHGADPSIKGHDGRTPREVALQKGDKDMAAILDNPGAMLGPPPAPTDGVAPAALIARFVADLAKNPPGPLENDVTEDDVQTLTGLAALTNTKISAHDAIETAFHVFTLDGPVTEFYARGLAAIYKGSATVTEAAAKQFKDDYDQSSATWTENGKTMTDKGPFIMFGPAAIQFTDPKVPSDRRVVASFCLVQQHGRWKVHCLYFSTAPLAGDNKDFIIKQLAAFSRKQGQ